MPKKNKLYAEQSEWDAMPLIDRLEAIRIDICTGPCGQSSAVHQRRQRINDTLKLAARHLEKESDE